MSETIIPPLLKIDTNLLVLILDAIEDIDAQMVGGDPIMMEDVAEEANVDVDLSVPWWWKN